MFSLINKILLQIIDDHDCGDSLACFVIKHKAQEILDISNKKQKLEQLQGLVSYIKDGQERADRNEIVDYTEWNIGDASLMGNEIGMCPICKQNGEIWPSYQDEFNGCTVHKTVVFFSGQQPLIRCDWETGKATEFAKLV